MEINSRRAFSESNIGGWDYLRNMVQLPFYLQNSALRRVKTAQAIAIKRMQVINSEDFSTSLQRSVSTKENSIIFFLFIIRHETSHITNIDCILNKMMKILIVDTGIRTPPILNIRSNVQSRKDKKPVIKRWSR